jgi:phosphoribosyl-ATP pyrophosphohydrolase/phosphoribosyl-AMP cyclohydrolase
VRPVDPTTLDWNKGGGLLPAIVQDAGDGAVLMLGYMSRESLEQTLDLGEVVFHSRSRQALWRKGETSGNVLGVVSIGMDCDADTLLIRARPAGPTCHLGARTCFDADEEPTTLPGFLGTLERIIDDRLDNPSDASYVAGLAARGSSRIAQKVGEEGVEFALAAAAGDRDEIVEEGADLLFHLMVALRDRDLALSDVIACLESRHRG